MGRKRHLSADTNLTQSSPPFQKVAKQLKMDKFIEATNNPPTAISSECCPDSLRLADLDHLSPLTRDLIKNLIEEQTGQASFSRAATQEKYSLDLPSQHFKQIISLLENIISLLKERLPTLQNNISPQRNTTHLISGTENLLATPPQILPVSRSSKSSDTKLILNSESLVLSIQQHPDWPQDWSQLWKAKKHLASILNLKPADINLLRMENLPSAPWQKRILLYFQNSKIPKLIFSQRQRLRVRGIAPLRHFQNQSLQKLFPTRPENANLAPKKAIPSTHSLDSTNRKTDDHQSTPSPSNFTDSNLGVTTASAHTSAPKPPLSPICVINRPQNTGFFTLIDASTNNSASLNTPPILPNPQEVKRLSPIIINEATLESSA